MMLTKLYNMEKYFKHHTNKHRHTSFHNPHKYIEKSHLGKKQTENTTDGTMVLLITDMRRNIKHYQTRRPITCCTHKLLDCFLLSNYCIN